MTDYIPAFSGNDPPDVQTHSHARYHAVMDRCKNLPPVATAVVHPVQAEAIEATADAARRKPDHAYPYRPTSAHRDGSCRSEDRYFAVENN